MTLAIQDHYADPILDDAISRDVIIDNRDNSNDLEDYQVQIDIDDDQLMLQGERGIRFVDENLQVLDYWEESDLNKWIKVAKVIGSKATAIRMLQKEGISSASDGNATFEFFDDFEGIEETSGSDYKVIVTSITRDEDAYIYKDFGSDHFDALDIDFEAKMTSGSSGICGIMALANAIDDLAYLSSPAVNVIFHESGGVYKIWLNRGPQDAYDYYECSLDTTYYMTLNRTAGSDTIELKIYSDSARTNLLDTLSVSGFGSAKYRYLYAVDSWDTDQADRILSCDTGNISIDGGSYEDLTEYSKTDPNSRFSVGQSSSYVLDADTWNTEYVDVTINHTETTVKLEGTTANRHGSIYAQNIFSSGVCSWKMTDYQQTSSNSCNTGVIYPYVETTNRDIFYWRTNGEGSWSEAALRINDDFIYQSSQESVNCIGRTDVYFAEGYGKVVHDGVVKLDKTDTALTIPDGMRPWIATYEDHSGYIIADWVLVRKYTSPEPTVVIE